MNESTTPAVSCPAAETWLDAISGHRDDLDALGKRPELRVHLADCSACRATVDEVRRYETMLLRAKVPGLAPEQRQALDERVRMMAAQWSPPPRVSPRLAWGIALAAAAVLVMLVARPFMQRRGERERAFAEQLTRATLPVGERGAGVATGAVEGDVEVADRVGQWRAMQAGELLQGGMRLRTLGAHPGSAQAVATSGQGTGRISSEGGRLVVPGRFELVLGAHTELDVLAVGPQVAYVRLRQGEVDCQVDKLRAGQQFAVMFAGFRASVLGTRFTVRHSSPEAGVSVQVTEGAVRVDAADDPAAPQAETTTTVRAGNRWQFAAGRMALEPIPLPAALPSVAVPVSMPLQAKAQVERPLPPIEGPMQVDGTWLKQPDKARRDGKSAAAKRSFVIEVPPQAMLPVVPVEDAGK